jgi:hypothetical protein
VRQSAMADLRCPSCFETPRIAAELCAGKSVDQPPSAQATRRRLDVRPAAAGRAESVRPRARTMRMTVLNSGLPASPSAL